MDSRIDYFVEKLLQRLLNSNSHGWGLPTMGELREAQRVKSRNLPVAGCHYAHGPGKNDLRRSGGHWS